MSREKAVLREFNLYPLWQRRGQTEPTLDPVVVAAQPVESNAAHKIVTEKVGAQDVSNLSWPDLKKMVKGCTACKLRTNCTQTIFGVGDVKADWLFLGAWPSINEDAQGVPFVEQTGNLLDNMLAAIKLKRDHNAYITHIVKCSPPGNGQPGSDEVAQCAPYLERQIQLIKPKLIVILGEAAALLLGYSATFASLRGKVHSYRSSSSDGLTESIPLIITHDPAHLLQVPMDKAQAWDGLCLAVATMQGLALD